VITAQLQQAISLLTMTNIELSAYLESQAEENPFLDCEPAVEATTDLPAVVEPIDMTKGEVAADGPIRDSDYDNQFETGVIEVGRGTKMGPRDDDGFDPLSLQATEDPSLYAHLTAEMLKIDFSAKDQLIAQRLIDAVELSGWLGQAVGEIAASLMVADTCVEKVLLRLQEIEPAGLFARDLRECLRLQAKDRGILSADFRVLLDNLTLLAEGDLKRIRKLANVTPERMSEMLRQLRALDPKPGTQFAGRSDPIQPPDLIVTRTPDGWKVELNHSTLPAIRVRKGYAKQMMQTGRRDLPSANFITERIASARWLDRAIAQRNDTTIRVGAAIVHQQQDFFERGVAFLKPLVLRDVADAISMHESTISRVTANLMMATPQGTFRLKDFFSAAITMDGNDEGEAATAIRHKLKKLIDSEASESPLSDDTLVKILGGTGIRIARRTVAKYREKLNIPSSFERKRQAALSGII
jgi:RNA polymerase sigma-54 factor